MTIRRTLSAAALLIRQINSTNRKPDVVEGGFAQAVGRRLEARHVTAVPGLPDDKSEPEWYDLAIESHRRHEEFLTDREAKHQAEQQAAQSTPDLIRSALAGATRQRSSTMPLNGTRVLHAALAGGGGTINSTRP
ncbi:Uncharacterised protein [Rhodococcus rhodochrous]|uniref:hypothetical protein n=1 Tax=Rhodococcus rhodochrous TaxID=1829 RepID=UPI000AC13FCA|nr:hypothetical protein [Rhodococcus rhodochrous]MDO1485102.1 hypothetical protein [Rhodococcus rhodochrous]SNV10169.1 Uncharacterised protein [Rhodococcus rhodochrous]